VQEATDCLVVVFSIGTYVCLEFLASALFCLLLFSVSRH